MNPINQNLPDWFPSWARQLADLYFSGTTCLFVLHGNTHDLLRFPDGNGDRYCNVAEFLAGQLFGSWDVVLHYDLARGLRPLAGSDSARLQSMVQFLGSKISGDPSTWPRDPESVLLLLDKLIERNLVEDEARRKSIGIILDYAQYLAPAGDLANYGRGQATNLVRLLTWAQHPYIKRQNIAFCLLADKLSEVNDRLVQNAHVAAIPVPLPDQGERERFCRSSAVGKAASLPAAATGQGQAGSLPHGPEEIAALANGLSLVNLNVLLSQGKRSGKPVDAVSFRQLKKSLIERQCQGLLEFLEPSHQLDLVVGQQAAKERLQEDAALITKGRLDAAPMGYLLCGPVGTGKTFMAECYAGTIGIPCVKLRNFRSKYVGETEGNLEQVLTVLRSLGPVVVIIDEADAALGTRQADGDAGTSSRVFAMIAGQMGDTTYRGKIIWMLLTSRPELLPIDLKRQGRAEVHIPLFYPQDEKEIRTMFLSMARKNKVALPEDAVPAGLAGKGLSGSDIESVVLGAKRIALTAGCVDVRAADVADAFRQFLPSTQGLEKEAQELAAVLECTQLDFLPAHWRAKVADRARLQERFMAIQQLLEK
jgi:AAA+ superfamily predicted ATPase